MTDHYDTLGVPRDADPANSVPEGLTMTSFDALAWIMEPSAPPFEEPRLPYAPPETIKACQCRDDGAILSADGGPFVISGRIWLSDYWRREAAYYGWKETGVVIQRDCGVTLYMVER